MPFWHIPTNYQFFCLLCGDWGIGVQLFTLCHYKTLQAHLYVSSPSQNQPFLPGVLAPLVGEWYEKSDLGTRCAHDLCCILTLDLISSANNLSNVSHWRICCFSSNTQYSFINFHFKLHFLNCWWKQATSLLKIQFYLLENWAQNAAMLCWVSI